MFQMVKWTAHRESIRSHQFTIKQEDGLNRASQAWEYELWFDNYVNIESNATKEKKYNETMQSKIHTLEKNLNKIPQE